MFSMLQHDTACFLYLEIGHDVVAHVSRAHRVLDGACESSQIAKLWPGPVRKLLLPCRSAVAALAAELAVGIATARTVAGAEPVVAAVHTVLAVAVHRLDLPCKHHRRSPNTLQGIAASEASEASASQTALAVDLRHQHTQAGTAAGIVLAAHSTAVARRCTAHTSGAALGWKSLPASLLPQQSWPKAAGLHTAAQA